MVQYNTSFLNPSTKIEFDKIKGGKLFVNSILGAKIYRNADIIPSKDNKFISGGVVDSEGHFIDNSAVAEDLGGIYEYDRFNIDTQSIPLIYIGLLSPCWGHVITDFLKKIWFLDSIEGKKWISKGAKICYVSRGNYPPPEYVVELISMLGYDMHDWLHIRYVTHCAEVIIPDNSLVAQKGYGRYYTYEYLKLIERIKTNVQKTVSPSYVYNDKIYLTRTHLKNGRDFGEEVIENLFKKKGFQIIAPEEYTLHEQIAILMHCKELVVTEGSIAHNAVFCASGTNLIIIRKADYRNSYQEVINYIADLNVTYIDAHKSVMARPDAPWVGPFYLCITPELENYFGHRIPHLPFWLRLSWYKYKYGGIYYTFRARLGLRTRFHNFFCHKHK